MSSAEQQPKLLVLNAQDQHVEDICALSAKVYPGEEPYRPNAIRSHLNHFPEGVWVALYEGQVVGYCATFRIRRTLAFAQHTWREITNNGLGSRHDPAGDWLYGMELFVDPDMQGRRIGQRLYNIRKRLCQDLRLKGIVIGGRIPGYRRRAKTLTPEEYVEQVQHKKIRDATLGFQLRNHFELVGVLKNYHPEDRPSRGYAAHLVWYNPQVNRDQPLETAPGLPQRYPAKVRVACVQYKMRRVRNWEQFARYLEYFVDVTADYQADFVVFPELLTLQLLSMEPNELRPNESIYRLTEYTERFKALLSELAINYNINIIGGSHPTRTTSGEVNNFCYVFLRDGSIHEQGKIHPTPNERYWWDIQGTDKLEPIPTDCGPIGVLICYDSEFPELTRHLVNQGALMLFVPFCTDERQGYIRVRTCCQARAIENQIYVAMAGNVGNLPGVANMDIQYAQSAIFTPSDFMFARDGVAAEATPNVEMVTVADLRLNELVQARNSGTVQNLHDRRFDLYEVRWKT